MKKHLLVLCASCLVFQNVNSQDFKIVPDVAHKDFIYKSDLAILEDKGNIEGIAKFYNLSTNPKDTLFTWKRTIKSAPPGWSFTVCDKLNCWLPTIGESTFPMPLRDSYLFDVNAYPKDIFDSEAKPTLGTAIVEILIYPTGNLKLAKTYTFTYILSTPAGVGVQENQLNLSIYPNPASNLVNIKTGQSIEGMQYTVVNAVGLPIADFAEVPLQVNSVTPINISNLAQGLYFVNITKDSKVLSRERFVKY